jgi:hypothetical protein
MQETLMCVVCRRILGSEVQEDTEYPKREEFMEGIHICVDCARKETVNSLVKKYGYLIKDLADLSNSTTCDHEGTLSDALVTVFTQQHRYLQNEIIILLLRIIKKIGALSGDSMYEDPRNQWALKWCREVSKLDTTL